MLVYADVHDAPHLHMSASVRGAQFDCLTDADYYSVPGGRCSNPPFWGLGYTGRR
jgi:hypothetical protein